MYVNGMGFRGIERVTGVHHTTVINWVRQVGERLLVIHASEEMLRHSIRLLLHYLKFWDVPIPQGFMASFSNA
jgi:hypothetical protein